MKILVFTEGTVLMHASAKDVSREEGVKQSKEAVAQKKVKPGSVYDFKSYIPIDSAVSKLKNWKKQGATILYLTSRRIKDEVEKIRDVLKKYNFPEYGSLYFRQLGEDYKDVAERILPDIIIEDDCESIGGQKGMTFPHIKPELKQKIKSIIVKEFEGIDKLSDNITEL